MPRKKASEPPAVTEEEFAALPDYRPDDLHFEFSVAKDDGPAETHTAERGAPAHGGGLTVDGTKAEAIKDGKGDTVYVKWLDGKIESFEGVATADVRVFPAN